MAANERAEPAHANTSATAREASVPRGLHNGRQEEGAKEDTYVPCGTRAGAHEIAERWVAIKITYRAVLSNERELSTELYRL